MLYSIFSILYKNKVQKTVQEYSVIITFHDEIKDIYFLPFFFVSPEIIFKKPSKGYVIPQTGLTT